MRLVFNLGGEQYDGNVARLGVVLKAAQQREAVHLGHHHVAYDEVWQRLCHRLERLAAVGVGGNMVFRAKLCREEVAYSLVIVNHDYLVSRGASPPLGPLTGVGCSFGYSLLRVGFHRPAGKETAVNNAALGQMAHAYGQGNGEDGAADAVGAVACHDVAAVQLHQFVRKVKAYAEAKLP